MRWLLVHPGPNFSVADVYDGWTNGLRALGEQVKEHRLDAELQTFDSLLAPDGDTGADGRGPVRKAFTTPQAIAMAAEGVFRSAYTWWPDVVLFVSAFFTTPFVLEVLRSRGHKIVMLFTESPYQDQQQLTMAPYAHLSLVNDPCTLARYREAGPAEYMPHSYRPSVHYPDPAAARLYDLAFVGTGFPARIRFFSSMGLDGLNVKLAGPWMDLPEDSPLRDWEKTRHLAGCTDNADTAALYRQARTGINFYRREGEQSWDQAAWACGPREIEMAACGLWFTRDPRGESDSLFPMLPSFTSPEEATDQIRWALAHPGERAEAAGKARAAIGDRTFVNAAQRLLALLDSQPVRV